MFERLSQGWELARCSWHVLKLDKELLVFPLISGTACLLVLASFAVPLWTTGYAEVLLNEGQPLDNPVAYAILFAFYAVNYFVIVFFNSALITCAIIRFRGGDPTVADGFRAAFARLPQIIGWALVTATVGLILRVIESRSERVGQIAAALLGAGWSIATYFVVPVLVVEKAGPIEAVKRSLSVMRRTWGESLGAEFGIGFFVFIAGLVAALPLIGGIVLLSTGAMIPGVALIAVGVLALILVSLISSALDSIVLAALYLYAAEGTVSHHFDDGLLSHAFAQR